MMSTSQFCDHLPLRRFCVPAQSVQYHFPFGFSFKPTHPKWNHSILHWKWSKIASIKFRTWWLIQQEETIINTGKTHIGIITCNHLSVAHLITDTISGLIRINWYIQVHARWICRYRGSCSCCCCCCCGRMTRSTRINCFQWEYCSMLINNKTKISHKPIKEFLKGSKTVSWWFQV